MLKIKFSCQFLSVIFFTIIGTACQKWEYTEMDKPAYLRVFNSLNLPDILGTGITDTLPYLCMLINPTFDNEGHPVGAEIVGDFLDRRASYAPPFPVNIGVSTTVDNPEYPGKEPVLAGPILNGFDLSSWAQIPSGTMRILFMFRPKNSTPFFKLDKYLRTNKAAAGTYDLAEGEVYTLQVVYDNFMERSKKIIFRQENFHKQSFSDSLVYVNFYNFTAEGYTSADSVLKFPSGRKIKNFFEGGIQDNMDIYLSLFDTIDYVPYREGVAIRGNPKLLEFYNRKFMYTMRRDLESNYNAPYFSFPMWHHSSQSKDAIFTDCWQRIEFVYSGYSLSKDNNTFEENGRILQDDDYKGGPYTNPKGYYASINFMLNGQILYTSPNAINYEINMGFNLPNLIISTHSGVHNPKSFATINTIEIINGEAYLMTLQRKYAPPHY